MDMAVFIFAMGYTSKWKNSITIGINYVNILFSEAPGRSGAIKPGETLLDRINRIDGLASMRPGR
jgi:hypothetical protein